MEKVEGQNRSGENSEPIVIVDATSASQGSDDQMQEYLKILSEETLQLSELLWQEEKLAKEFCSLLKHVLRQLHLSFNLPANILPHREKIQHIILSEEAHLILINDKNEVTSKALEDYPPNVVSNMVSFIIPELSKSLTLYRKKISLRIELFDQVNRELRNLSNTYENQPQKPEGGPSPVDNGVKKALSTQQKDTNEK